MKNNGDDDEDEENRSEASAGDELDQYLAEMVKVLREHRQDLAERLSQAAQEERGLEVALERLKQWDSRREFVDKTARLKDRTPLGVVVPPVVGADSCFAVQTAAGERIRINQPLLLYDPDSDLLASGFVDSFAMRTKEQVEKRELKFKVRVYRAHGTRLVDQEPVEDYLGLGALVFSARPEEVPEIYGVPSEGPCVGFLSQNNEPIRTQYGGIPFRLSPEFFESHTCISGITGAGKSVALKNLLKATVKWAIDRDLHGHQFDVNCIVFDVQGDLVQIMRRAPPERIVPEASNQFAELGLDFKGLGDFLDETECAFLRPHYYESPRGFPYLMPWRPFSLDSSRIRTGEDLCYFMPELTKRGAELVRTLHAMFVENFESEVPEGQSPFRLDLFYAFFRGGLHDKGGTWALPLSGEEVSQSAPVVNAVHARLKALRKAGVFDRGDPFDVGDVLSKRLAFVYFPKLKGYNTLRTMVLFQLLSEIVEYKKNPPSDAPEEVKRRKTIIFVDEAHQLLPSSQGAGVDSAFASFVDEKFAEIAQEGRKYDVFLVVASQALKYLNPRVIDQCNNRFFLQQSQADSTIVRKFFERGADAKRLFRLKQGVGVLVAGHQAREIVEVKFLVPGYLHEKPPVAASMFAGEIERKRRVEEERQAMVRATSATGDAGDDAGALYRSWVERLESSLEQAVEKDADRRRELEERLSQLVDRLTGNVRWVSRVDGRSTSEMSVEEVARHVERVVKLAKLEGKHLRDVVVGLAVAIKDEKTIGVKLVGPPGEGKTVLATRLVEYFCPGGVQRVLPCSEETLEEDLFFGVNPRSLADPEAEPYKFGVFSNVPFYPTWVVLDEANRVPERIYGGPALAALSERKIALPNGVVYKAPPDWKVFFTLNPLDLGLFRFPAALENRCASVVVPYAGDDAARKVAARVLPEGSERVVDALVMLRRETIACSPLEKAFKGEYASIDAGYSVELHGMSTRVLERVASQYAHYLALLSDQRRAFVAACLAAEESVLVDKTGEEREQFRAMVDAVSELLV
ncbi:MAG: hypothetical protein Kow0069_13250 [Promethearchaeota archaeon]